jgi:hypothetical protein
MKKLSLAFILISASLSVFANTENSCSLNCSSRYGEWELVAHTTDYKRWISTCVVTDKEGEVFYKDTTSSVIVWEERSDETGEAEVKEKRRARKEAKQGLKADKALAECNGLN